MKTNYILTIAGSDIFSGGGLQADLATFAVEGLHGFLALTATTALMEGEFEITPLPFVSFARQLESLHSIPFEAIKIGLLPTVEIAALVLDFIQSHPTIPVVLDPVMVFKENQDGQVNRLREQLLQFLPYVTVLTPNLKEAELLTQVKIETVEDMERSALILEKAGARSVVVKGGSRLPKEAALDLFCENGETVLLQGPLSSANNTGAGCTFASSIASQLAKGQDSLAAVKYAKDFVYRAIEKSNEYGVVQYDPK